MGDQLVACPMCGQPLTSYGPRWDRFVDCPRQHHATSDPMTWHVAVIRAALRDDPGFRHPDTSPDCVEHVWEVLHDSPAFSVAECVHCHGWAAKAPGAR